MATKPSKKPARGKLRPSPKRKPAAKAKDLRADAPSRRKMYETK